MQPELELRKMLKNGLNVFLALAIQSDIVTQKMISPISKWELIIIKKEMLMYFFQNALELMVADSNFNQN